MSLLRRPTHAAESGPIAPRTADDVRREMASISDRLRLACRDETHARCRALLSYAHARLNGLLDELDVLR